MCSTTRAASRFGSHSCPRNNVSSSIHRTLFSPACRINSWGSSPRDNFSREWTAKPQSGRSRCAPRSPPLRKANTRLSCKNLPPYFQLNSPTPYLQPEAYNTSLISSRDSHYRICPIIASLPHKVLSSSGRSKTSCPVASSGRATAHALYPPSSCQRRTEHGDSVWIAGP